MADAADRSDAKCPPAWIDAHTVTTGIVILAERVRRKTLDDPDWKAGLRSHLASWIRSFNTWMWLVGGFVHTGACRIQVSTHPYVSVNSLRFKLSFRSAGMHACMHAVVSGAGSVWAGASVDDAAVRVSCAMGTCPTGLTSCVSRGDC